MQYLLSILVTWIILFWWLFLFKKLRILDRPWSDIAWQRKPVPTILWIFVFIAFLTNVFIFFPWYFQNNIFLWLIAWWGIIIFFSLLDELNYLWILKRKIPLSVRALSHILACLVALRISWLNIVDIKIWSFTFDIPIIVFTLFFIVWSVICINAINRFDGINWQASGVSAIWFITIFLIIKFIVIPNYPVITENEKFILDMIQNLSFFLFVIGLISTIIEYKPIWLLRDVWIMFFGFAIAYLSILWWAKIWTLLVALSLVIFDWIRVGINRIFIMKKNPIKWDYTHLHYRLMWLGRSKKETRVFVRIWSIVMMILMLMQWINRTNKIIILIMMALIFFGVNIYLFWIKKLPCWLKINKDN